MAAELAARFGRLDVVTAVAFGGSGTTLLADRFSDVDLYVYCLSDVPVSFREALARSRSDRFEIDNRTWETGDEWRDRETGLSIDIMFRDPRWIEDVITGLLEKAQPSVGYSTTLWHNVVTSVPLFDRSGWFADLQNRSRSPYPDSLAAAIVEKNLPLLDRRLSSFTRQMATAARRGDRVAVNHRITAFLASNFDVLFAINLKPHPGEKRLREHGRLLPIQPSGWEDGVDRLLLLAFSGS